MSFLLFINFLFFIPPKPICVYLFTLVQEIIRFRVPRLVQFQLFEKLTRVQINFKLNERNRMTVDTSYEFFATVPTVDLSKHWIAACLIRKFIWARPFCDFQRFLFPFRQLSMVRPVWAGTFGKWAIFLKETSIITGSFYLGKLLCENLFNLEHFCDKILSTWVKRKHTWQVATDRKLALANEDTLLRTHNINCCRHKCFPVCSRAQHLLRTQKCFWFCSETFCVRNKCFHSLRSIRNTMSNNVSATMCHRLPAGGPFLKADVQNPGVGGTPISRKGWGMLVVWGTNQGVWSHLGVLTTKHHHF